MRFAQVASRAFGRPLLLEPRRGLSFLRALASEIGRRDMDAVLQMAAMEDGDETVVPEDA